MLGSSKLSAKSGTSALQHIALRYRVSLVKHLVHRSCESLAIVHIYAAVLVDKHPEVPRCSLLFKPYVPKEKAKLVCDRLCKLSYFFYRSFLYFHTAPPLMLPKAKSSGFAMKKSPIQNQKTGSQVPVFH